MLHLCQTFLLGFADRSDTRAFSLGPFQWILSDDGECVDLSEHGHLIKWVSSCSER